MFNRFKTPCWCVLIAALWGITQTAFCQQSGEADASFPAATTSPQQIKKQDVEQLLNDVKEQQKALEKRASSQAYSDSDGNEQVKTLLTIFDQIDSLYQQQIAELGRLQTLEAKKQDLHADFVKLKQAPPADRRYSFAELDQSRNELAIETRRSTALNSKIALAEESLEQASDVMRQKEEKLSALENAKASADSGVKTSDLALEIARGELELARQTQALRALELRSERTAKSVHQQQLDVLQARVDFLQQHARFEPAELQEQLRRIDKEEFELKRVIAQSKERQSFVKSRLEQTRKRLFAAPPGERQGIEKEADTLQLNFEALKNRIDSATQRIELLDDSKQVWRHRYAVFNQSVEAAQLSKWKQHAKRQLEAIERELEILRLWLGDWQSRRTSLDTKVENGAISASTDSTTAAKQREFVEQIIDTLRDQQHTLENNRRLYEKLIDEIDVRTASRSWRDWADWMLNFRLHDNTVLDWSYALASALVTFLLLYFLRWILIRRLKFVDQKTSQPTLASGFLNSVKRANSVFFFMIAVFVASKFLTLDMETKQVINNLTKVVFVLQAAVWGSGLVRTWVFLILARRTKRDGASMGALTIFNFASQVALWSLALLLILQNLGIDVTALVAGLGIGGIAVALSLQRILNDLFSSLSIVLDKPFVVGDFVVFDDYFGSIEHIGTKTTRIRSLSGEQIICANGDLLNTRIRNFKRMHERRVVFKLGVVYQTPENKLRKIPGMIREIIEVQPNSRFDRAHFYAYGDFALLFEIVYYVLSSDYNLYMDTQQAINLEIYRKFQANGIEFAYPTQSLYLQQLST